MSKKIIYIGIFLIGVAINLYNFTDVFGETAIPKFRPFGNSTTFTDSTGYININDGINLPNDSMRIGKDLYVGVKGGSIYLDTNRQGLIYFIGNDFYIKNLKQSSSMNFVLGEGGGFAEPNLSIGTTNTALMTLDSSSGLTILYGNIRLSGGTQQIKLPSDTASDYDANDAVTINRQSGFLTTKSLTTAAGTAYDLTLSNTLITPTSKIHGMVIYGAGTCTALAMVIHVATIGSGSCIISIYNPASATALNGTVKLQFWVWN